MRKFFGKNITPSCYYCVYSKKCEDIISCEKGLMPMTSSSRRCNKYKYSPFKRVPEEQAKMPNFSAEDFKL
ncbi:MAG: hypothetical protein LBJ95_04700 [Oscillospiraceae bacterium]|jgi:hypothetical protein|nr:hypothetical protein [Oscillospiraceae bacterium]